MNDTPIKCCSHPNKIYTGGKTFGSKLHGNKVLYSYACPDCGNPVLSPEEPAELIPTEQANCGHEGSIWIAEIKAQDGIVWQRYMCPACLLKFITTVKPIDHKLPRSSCEHRRSVINKGQCIYGSCGRIFVFDILSCPDCGQSFGF